MANVELERVQYIPGYKAILNAVIKSQIQQLVEQLAVHTDEESIVLTASVADGTLSHLGSKSGKGFLDNYEDIKSQFLGYCLKNKHRLVSLKNQETGCRQIHSTLAKHVTPSLRPVSTEKQSCSSNYYTRSSRIRQKPYAHGKTPERKTLNAEQRNESLLSKPSVSSGDAESLSEVQVTMCDHNSEIKVECLDNFDDAFTFKETSKAKYDEMFAKEVSEVKSKDKDQESFQNEAQELTRNINQIPFCETSNCQQGTVSGSCLDNLAGDSNDESEIKVEEISESELQIEITDVKSLETEVAVSGPNDGITVLTPDDGTTPQSSNKHRLVSQNNQETGCRQIHPATAKHVTSSLKPMSAAKQSCCSNYYTRSSRIRQKPYAHGKTVDRKSLNTEQRNESMLSKPSVCSGEAESGSDGKNDEISEIKFKYKDHETFQNDAQELSRNINHIAFCETSNCQQGKISGSCLDNLAGHSNSESEIKVGPDVEMIQEVVDSTVKVEEISESELQIEITDVESLETEVAVSGPRDGITVLIPDDVTTPQSSKQDPDNPGGTKSQDLDEEDQEASIVVDNLGVDEATCIEDDLGEPDPKENGMLNRESKFTTVAFSGCFPNQRFFKLFDKFKMTNKIEDTGILIVPSFEYGKTSCTTLKLFQSLLGRRVKIVSKKWVEDSIMLGSIQDLSKYLVTSASRYGKWSDSEDYQAFEFQIVGKEWIDITEFDVRNLLKIMKGIEVLNASSTTVIICADGEIHTSDRCVGKEWIFHSIVAGRIKLPSLKNDCDRDDSSGDESIEVEHQAVTPDKKIYIQTSGSVSGKRSQKRQCCLYCGELNTKLSRHMATHHASEKEVAKILSLPKKSTKRRKAWIEIGAKGNSLYNDKVREAGTGMIIPKYRPSANKNEKKYLPCEYCKAYIVKSDLWKHHKTCVVKTDGVKSERPVKNSSLLVPKDCSHESYRDVFSKMPDDVITTIVKSDPLIKKFGERRYERTGKHQHAHQHISELMRELGRVVQAMKKHDKEITSLSQCLNPQKWRSVIKASQDVAGFDAEGQNFRSPSNALKVGNSLKKCARILRNQAIEAGDAVLKERMNTFIELYEDEWEEHVSGAALESLETAVINKRLEDINVIYDVVLDDLSDDNDDEEDNGDSEDVGVSSRDRPPSNQHFQGRRKQEQTENDSGDEWKPPSKKSRTCSSSDSDDYDKPPRSKSKSNCFTRRPWTEAEQQIVLRDMKKNILLQKLPGKQQCEELIHNHKELGQRSWTMIKDFVRNKITAAKRHLRADKT